MGQGGSARSQPEKHTPARDLGADVPGHSHPLLGREAEHGRRELILSRGRYGYIAKYRCLPANATIPSRDACAHYFNII